MKDTEKFYHVRLVGNEIDYINNHWDGKFSDFVHNAIKNEEVKSKKNRIRNNLQNSLTHITMLGFGAIFIFYSLNTSTLIGFLLPFLLGVFFISTSLVSIFVEVKNKWKMNS